MAWHFKRWRIKWNKKARRFKKIRRNRQLSRAAHVRFIRNRAKMKAALRKTRIKGKIANRKNKAAGLYRKLSLARKRWKNILKSDMNLDKYFDYLINEDKNAPEITLGPDDISDIKKSLEMMKQNLEFDDEDQKKDFDEYVDLSLDYLDSLSDNDDLDNQDEDFLSELLSFIEEFGEEAGLINSDEKAEK